MANKKCCVSCGRDTSNPSGVCSKCNNTNHAKGVRSIEAKLDWDFSSERDKNNLEDLWVHQGYWE
jgi:NMD protein affecting ribosome stability and mRNA decay